MFFACYPLSCGPNSDDSLITGHCLPRLSYRLTCQPERTPALCAGPSPVSQNPEIFSTPPWLEKEEGATCQGSATNRQRRRLCHRPAPARPQTKERQRKPPDSMMLCVVPLPIRPHPNTKTTQHNRSRALFPCSPPTGGH